MTTEAKRREYYRKINRRVIRQLENECGDRDLDLIDTFDYRDIFDRIKADESDLSPDVYLPQRFR